MTHISRADAIALTKKLEAAINEALEANGFRSTKMRTTYGDMYAIKVEAVPADAPSPEADDYTRYANLMYDLPVDGLGRTVTISGRRFTITGINMKAAKRPITALGTDGKTYRLTAESVKAALAKVTA